MFIQPPEVLTVGGLWKWGVIVFINCFFLWVILGTIFGRFIHLKYLQNYYFFENLFQLKVSSKTTLISFFKTPRSDHSLRVCLLHLQKDCCYDFKITISGEQFTHTKGIFVLNDPYRGEIFSYPLEVYFPEGE